MENFCGKKGRIQSLLIMFVHRKCFRGRAAVPQSVPNVLNDGGDEFGICRLTLAESVVLPKSSNCM